MNDSSSGLDSPWSYSAARLSRMSASFTPSGVGARIGSSTCRDWVFASAQVAGMYSSLTPSMCAVTCQTCRNASASAAGIGTFQAFSLFMVKVARLCQVTMMSAWLIGLASGAAAFQWRDFGSRWRTAAWVSRVFTQVTTICPRSPYASLSADVVAELRRLGDPVLHVRAAGGVVDRARLAGDDAAHHPAAEPVEDAEVETAPLVEVEDPVELGLVRPRRQLAGPLDERRQVGRESGRQRLGVVRPARQQLVDARRPRPARTAP